MFSTKDIIDIAVQIERNGESVFRDAVKTISNPALVSLLQWLADHWNSDVGSLEQSGQANPRWIEKIGRTLEKPFTNDEVMARLEGLSQTFSEAMRFVEALPSGSMRSGASPRGASASAPT